MNLTDIRLPDLVANQYSFLRIIGKEAELTLLTRPLLEANVQPVRKFDIHIALVIHFDVTLEMSTFAAESKATTPTVRTQHQHHLQYDTKTFSGSLEC
jgi:hypothetical protein